MGIVGIVAVLVIGLGLSVGVGAYIAWCDDHEPLPDTWLADCRARLRREDEGLE